MYEHGLREELGEDGAGVAELRGKITWVDDSRKALGFSEHHPVDNLGRDGYRSQANRRVENLFFDDGEEPDMALAEAAPEQSELYLPGIYERRHLGAMGSAKPKAMEVLVEVGGGLP